MSFSLPHEQVKETISHEIVPDASNFWTEAKLLAELAIPTIIIQLGFTAPPFLTASYVGTSFGHVHLDGYTLANMTGNLCTLALLAGFFSATDTLSPQAFGAGNYREVGLLAIRGFVASTVVIVAINTFLVPYLGPLLVYLGQDLEASRLAAEFYEIYFLSLPFNALYVITWKFLSTQHILAPIVVDVLVSSLVVLPLCLQVCTKHFGFRGAALALVIYQAFEALALLAYIRMKRSYHPETWPGVSAWREAVQWEKFKHYLVLGIGGVLASLEWVYWEALALVVGLLGVIPLSIHAIPTQVILVTFMLPLGLGTALSIRLGATISRNVKRAKLLALSAFAAGTIITLLEVIPMWFLRERIFRLFTEEERVLEGSEQIWAKVCFYHFNLGIFGINMGIATGLGMQWTLGVTTVVFLWLFGLPACYFFAVVQGRGIDEAWRWIWPPYLFINAIVMTSFVVKDWEQISKSVRLRETLEGDELESLLLTAEVVSSTYGSTATRKKKAEPELELE